MKVSILLGTVATVASMANAFPFMAELIKDGIVDKDGNIDQRGLLDSLNQGLSHLKGALGAPKFSNAQQLNTLNQQFQEAMQQLKGVKMPTPQLINTPRDQLSDSAIYNAYGLGSGSFGNTDQIWSQDTAADFANYRPFPPAYPTGNVAQAPYNASAIQARSLDFQLPSLNFDYDNVIGWGPAENEKHPWFPPTHGQTRGPCPGLNTAANHGYLPRSGIVTPLQLLVGTWQALSLAPDMCLLLGTLSFIFKGDPVHMTLSIGTNKDVYGNPMPNHLGTGIGEHGVLEGDASVTRKDHSLGNVWALDEGLYRTFLSEIEGPGGGQVNVKALAAGRYRAWKTTVKDNDIGDFNPWRMIVAYAESGFTHEALRGDSKEFTPQMIESWFYYERFPPCWQRRKVPITIAEMLGWGAVVWAASPVDISGFPTPGWSVFGLWVPIITLPSFGKFWGMLSTGGGKNTLGNLGCSLKGTFYDGILPGWLRNMIGSINLGGQTGFNC